MPTNDWTFAICMSRVWTSAFWSCYLIYFPSRVAWTISACNLIEQIMIKIWSFFLPLSFPFSRGFSVFTICPWNITWDEHCKTPWSIWALKVWYLKTVNREKFKFLTNNFLIIAFQSGHWRCLRWGNVSNGSRYRRTWRFGRGCRFG